MMKDRSTKADALAAARALVEGEAPASPSAARTRALAKGPLLDEARAEEPSAEAVEAADLVLLACLRLGGAEGARAEAAGLVAGWYRRGERTLYADALAWAASGRGDAAPEEWLPLALERPPKGVGPAPTWEGAVAEAARLLTAPRVSLLCLALAVARGDNADAAALLWTGGAASDPVLAVAGALTGAGAPAAVAAGLARTAVEGAAAALGGEDAAAQRAETWVLRFVQLARGGGPCAGVAAAVAAEVAAAFPAALGAKAGAVEAVLAALAERGAAQTACGYAADGLVRRVAPMLAARPGTRGASAFFAGADPAVALPFLLGAAAGGSAGARRLLDGALTEHRAPRAAVVVLADCARAATRHGSSDAALPPSPTAPGAAAFTWAAAPSHPGALCGAAAVPPQDDDADAGGEPALAAEALGALGRWAGSAAARPDDAAALAARLVRALFEAPEDRACVRALSSLPSLLARPEAAAEVVRLAAARMATTPTDAGVFDRLAPLLAVRVIRSDSFAAAAGELDAPLPSALCALLRSGEAGAPREVRQVAAEMVGRLSPAEVVPAALTGVLRARDGGEARLCLYVTGCSLSSHGGEALRAGCGAAAVEAALWQALAAAGDDERRARACVDVLATVVIVESRAGETRGARALASLLSGASPPVAGAGAGGDAAWPPPWVAPAGVSPAPPPSRPRRLDAAEAAALVAWRACAMCPPEHLGTLAAELLPAAGAAAAAGTAPAGALARAAFEMCARLPGTGGEVARAAPSLLPLALAAAASPATAVDGVRLAGALLARAPAEIAPRAAAVRDALRAAATTAPDAREAALLLLEQL